MRGRRPRASPRGTKHALLRGMPPRSTLWHVLAAALLAAGCSSSHPDDACRRDAVQCRDRCCAVVASPTYDSECNASCPAGSAPLASCTPAPDCACPPGDAALRGCFGGPCCDEWRAPSPVPGTCDSVCPDGFSFECEPDPAAFCAEPWARCDVPSDCILAPESGCCFPCGDALALEDVRAISRHFAEQYYESQCPGALECPACAPATNPSLQTTCNAGFCEAIDVRRLPLSACTSDDECRLRVPDCCECGAEVNPETLIALNVDQGGAYTPLVCGPFGDDPGEDPCFPCAAEYPDTLEAYCAADGHCDIRPAS
jgi:hypothetical protein